MFVPRETSFMSASGMSHDATVKEFSQCHHSEKLSITETLKIEIPIVIFVFYCLVAVK